MLSSFSVPTRFCGPPASGNGGYTAGLLAKSLAGAAEVTLRKPIPLEKPMQVHRIAAGGRLELRDGQELIGEAMPADWSSDERLPSVSFEQAEAAAAASPAFQGHPFPTCFVCGPHRTAGDGLRLFPGAVAGVVSPEGGPVFAAPWIPDPSLADEAGNVREEFIWAAMDCPTGFAGGFPSFGKLVTGRLAVKLLSPVRTGERCILLSWPRGIEGRKHHASAALVGQNGTAHAHAKATWIRLD